MNRAVRRTFDEARTLAKPVPGYGGGRRCDDVRWASSSRGWNIGIGLPAGWSWEHLVLALVLSGALAWWLPGFHADHALPATDEGNRPGTRTSGKPGRPSWRVGWGCRRPRLFAWCRAGCRPCSGRSVASPGCWCRLSSGRQRASTSERRFLLHELAHLKRRDHWVRWLELIVGGLYWWHPAVWWGRRLLREAEEQCCDAWVVWAMPQGAKTYATALLAAIEFVSGARTAPAASSATSGNGHVSCLKRRLKMIVRAQNSERPFLGRPSGRAGNGPPCCCPWAKLGSKE